MPNDLGSRYILVNVPEFELKLVDGSRPVLQMRVIVGKAQSKTPAFSNRITRIDLNPVWHLPPSIVQHEVAPAVAHDPGYLARKHLERQVKDPELREKLTPRYRMGCKRVLISDNYYPALQRPNVDVVTDRIAEVKPHSIVTADGSEREIDALILGTGFYVTDMPVANYVRGREGRTMGEVWQGSPQA